MNWKIIFQLSIFGLIMALGTISLIPEKTEPVFWIFIFCFCAYVIAKVCRGQVFFTRLDNRNGERSMDNCNSHSI